MKKVILAFFVTVLVLFTGCNPKESKENMIGTAPVKITATATSGVENSEETVVILETTQGKIALKLFPKIAPLAVENFITHSQNGYYNGLIFHRVIKDFMIQGGDPTGTGMGGDSIWDKEFVNEYAPNVVFDKPFMLAMANHGANTNGSQFFITTKATPWLNGGYTIFGEVLSGQDVVQKIENVETADADRPVSEQKIIKAYVQ